LFFRTISNLSDIRERGIKTRMLILVGRQKIWRNFQMAKQMTPAMRRKANALIRTTCCNYDNGKCILLEDGDECVCVQSISYSLICKWLINAVLPADETLFSEVMGHGMKCCAVCGTLFTLRSNRAKYCKECSRKVHQRQKNSSNKKKHGNTDN